MIAYFGLLVNEKHEIFAKYFYKISINTNICLFFVKCAKYFKNG